MNNPYHDLSHQFNHISLGNNHSSQSYQYGTAPSLYSSAPQISNVPQVAFVDSRGQAPYSQDTTYTTPTPLQSVSNQYSKFPISGQFTSAPSSYQSASNFSGTQQNPLYIQQVLSNPTNTPNQQNMNHWTQFPDLYNQNFDSRIPREGVKPTPDVQRQVQGGQDLNPPHSALPQQVAPQAIQDPRTMQLSRQSSQKYQQNGGVEARQAALPYVQIQQGLKEQQFAYNQQGQMQQGQQQQHNQQQHIFNQQHQQGTHSSHSQENPPGSFYLQSKTGQNMPPQNAQKSDPQPITSQQYDPQKMPYQGMQPQGTLQQTMPQQRLQNQDFRQQNQDENNAPNSWEKFDESAYRGVPNRNSTELFQQYVQQRQNNQSFVNDTDRMPTNQSEQLHQSDQKPPVQMNQIRYPPSSIYPSTSAPQFAQQRSHLQQLPPLSSSPQTQFERYPSNPNENFRNSPQIPNLGTMQMPPPSSQHNIMQYPSQAYSQQYPNEQKMDVPNQKISQKTQQSLDQQAVYATQTDPSFSISRQNLSQANSQPIQTSQYRTNYPNMDQNIAQNVSQNLPYSQRNPVASATFGGQNIQDRNQFRFSFATDNSQAIRYEGNKLPFFGQKAGNPIPTSSNTLQRQSSQNQPIQSQANPPYSNFPQSKSQVYAKTMDEDIRNGRLPSLYDSSSSHNGVTQNQPYQTAHPGIAYANQNQVPLHNPAGIYDKNVPPYMSSSHQIFQNQANPASIQSQIRDPSQQMNPLQQLNPSQKINPPELRNPEENTRQFQDPRNQYQRQYSSQNNPQNFVQDRQHAVSNPKDPDQRNPSQANNIPNATNPSFNPTPRYQYPGQDRVDDNVMPSNTNYSRSNTAHQDQTGLVHQFQRLNSNEPSMPNQNQNVIKNQANPSQQQYNPQMNIRNAGMNPGPRFMNPNNPPGNPGVYPPTEVNFRAGPYDTSAQHNINRQASGPSQPIVIMPGYSSSVTNTRTTQENFEPRIESIFEQISDKQGPMFEKLRKILVDVFNVQDDVMNFKGRRGDQEYINIEEMLTRQLLTLDSVHTDGNEEIRLSRRSIVRQVQGLISTLERRAKT